jgi:hypothetical protein
MNNKIKLLMVAGLMAAGMGVACAHVQFKVDQSKINSSGGKIAYSVNLFDKNDQVKNDGMSPVDLTKEGVIKMLGYELPVINRDFSSYTDSFSFGGSQSTFDMQLPTTAGAMKCHFNAQQLKSASINNETITLPNATYCTPG